MAIQVRDAGSNLENLASSKTLQCLCAGGKVVSVGKTKDALRDGWIKNNRKKIIEIDCGSKVVLPDLSIRNPSGFYFSAARGLRASNRRRHI